MTDINIDDIKVKRIETRKGTYKDGNVEWTTEVQTFDNEETSEQTTEANTQ